MWLTLERVTSTEIIMAYLCTNLWKCMEQFSLSAAVIVRFSTPISTSFVKLGYQSSLYALELQKNIWTFLVLSIAPSKNPTSLKGFVSYSRAVWKLAFNLASPICIWLNDILLNSHATQSHHLICCYCYYTPISFGFTKHLWNPSQVAHSAFNPAVEPSIKKQTVVGHGPTQYRTLL